MSLPYYIKHWFFTLAVSPVLLYLCRLVVGLPNNDLLNLFKIYPFTFVTSALFSIPTYIIYLVTFYLLKKRKVDTGVAKLILVGLTAAGIYITLRLLLPEAPIWKVFRTVYPAAAITIGLLLKLKYEES